MTLVISDNDTQQQQQHVSSTTDNHNNDSVRKRYESMSFDEMTQHMAESYRQLSEVLGNRISLPSAASSEGGADSSYSPTFDVPSDNEEDVDEVLDRNDWDDDKKRFKMNKLFSRAVSSGDVDRVTQLLSNDKTKEYIDVNAKDEDGATPLIYAACFGKVEIAQALLEAGAKTDIQDSCELLLWETNMQQTCH